MIISQIFTAANYEYCVYWILRQDGTIKLEIRLTGILNTYICADGEDIGPWGTVVYPNVNAHNHQHLFSLRIHPRIDGDNNSAATSDAKPSPFPTGSTQNMYGNAFTVKRLPSKQSKSLLPILKVPLPELGICIIQALFTNIQASLQLINYGLLSAHHY